MSESQTGPGEDLRAAREAMEVSTREVADALNLPIHVIEALEADDYERLRPTVFTRGYLRSYARLLELPQDELLARYPEVTEEVEAVQPPAPSGPLANRQVVVLATAAVIVIALGLVWILGGEDEAPSKTAAPTTETTAPVRTPAADEPVATPSPPEAAEATEQGPAEVIDETPEPVDVEAVAEPVAREARDVPPEPSAPLAQSPQDRAEVPTPVTVAEEAAPTEVAEATGPAATDAAPAPSRLERRITEFGDDQLLFVFSEDCWVEVKSMDGENLYSDLNRAGRTLVLTGRAPFRVLLGYAPGVTLEFNGEPVALSRFSRNNVANVVLGQ